MKIEIIRCLQDNYSYLLIDEKNNYACVIDPSESKPIINFIENNNIKLKIILNTHHHFDHVGGNKDLKILMFLFSQKLKKSLIVHICRFGVLYHSLGRALVTGIVPFINN